MLKNAKIWEKIEELITEKIEEHNIDEKKLKNGIFYLNGNDGTEFDFFANDRLCEIVKEYDDDYFAVKLFLGKKGDLSIYTFPDLEDRNKVFEDKIRSFISEEEFEEFCANIYEYTDAKDIYDDKINPNIFNKKYDKPEFLIEDDFEKENVDEEEEYDYY